eukprot:symbB.v1.2.011348.t1/scaffold745.1/size165919/5
MRRDAAARSSDPTEAQTLNYRGIRLQVQLDMFGEACAKDLGLFATAAKWLRCSSKGTALGEVIVHANS